MRAFLSDDRSQLLQRPIRARVRCHVDVGQPTRAVLDDNKHVQHPKRRSDGHEQVAGEAQNSSRHRRSARLVPPRATSRRIYARRRWATGANTDDRGMEAGTARRHRRRCLVERALGCDLLSGQVRDSLATHVGRDLGVGEKNQARAARRPRKSGSKPSPSPMSARMEGSGTRAVPMLQSNSPSICAARVPRPPPMLATFSRPTV